MRRRWTYWAAALLVVVMVTALALTAQKLSHDRQTWRASRQDDVRETVLLYQMAFLSQSQTYYVATGTFGQTMAAPDAAFMRRFRNAVPPVLPLPDVWAPSAGAHGRYLYRGRTAAVVRVGGVHWNLDGSADVEGGMSGGYHYGTYGVFHVVCHHDDWYVTDYEQRVGI